MCACRESWSDLSGFFIPIVFSSILSWEAYEIMVQTLYLVIPLTLLLGQYPNFDQFYPGASFQGKVSQFSIRIWTGNQKICHEDNCFGFGYVEMWMLCSR
jgi:hypothetical protein